MGAGSFMATNSRSGFSKVILAAALPILPNPLMAMRFFMVCFGKVFLIVV